MKFRTTLFLLLLVLAGALGVYLLEQHTPSADERARRNRFVLDFNQDRVEWLRLQTADYTVTCRRHGQDWVITEPTPSRADLATVNRLLTAMEDWQRLETLRPADLKQRNLSAQDYGLHAPRAEISWGDALSTHTLRIGRDAPMGEAVYVQRDHEQDILVATPTLWAALPDDIKDFRSRRLFEGPPLRTTRLEIKRPEGFLRVVRSPDGAWTLQQPDRGRADPNFVLDLIETLHEARILSFVSDQPGDFAVYGLDVPRVEIALTGPGDVLPQVLFLGDNVEGQPSAVYARLGDAGSVVSVDQSLYQTALLDANVLRNRRLMNWDPNEVTQVEIRAKAEVLSLERDPATEEWWIVRPVRRKARAELVNALVSTWCKASILEFVADDVSDFAPYAMDPPVFRITLATAPPPAPATGPAMPALEAVPEDDLAPPAPPRFVTVALGNVEAERERLLVRREDRNSVFELNLQMLQLLSVSPTYYYDHEVLRLDPNTVRSFTLEREGTRQTLERGTNGSFLPVDAPAGTELDKERVEALFDTLRSLRAVEFLPFVPDELQGYGLETPFASLTIRFTEDAGISQAILFGDPFESVGRHATIRGQDILFVLSSDIAERLLQDLYPRPAPATEPAPTP